MKATTRVRFFWRPDSQGNMQVYGVHTGEGTPYEGVRVALIKWAEENQRYEFTPAGSVDGPLITWTPETPAGAVGPSHTGHDVKPIDQATILVTPIPTGEDEYTTPAFPVPHERDLNDYILVFPADAGMEPIYVYLSEGKDRVAITDEVGKYQPNKGAVGNMGEFFAQPGFGGQLKESAQKTNQIYQGQSVYKATGNIGDTIKKGDQLYLDGQHKDHIEIFDSKGNFKAVVNLDGTRNQEKTNLAKGRKLR